MKELIKFALKECRLPEVLNFDLPKETFIRLFGEKMIEAAKKTLSEKAVGLAKRWKNQDQLKILEEIFYLFRSKDQVEIQTTEEGISKLLDFERKKNLEITYRNYLPYYFNELEPNCLGKEMQLSAFMNLANAKHYSALVIRHLSEIDCEETLKFIQEIREDLRQRGLENDAEFEKSLKLQEFTSKIRLDSEIRFHAGIVVQVANNMWVMVDPYGISWGKLPEEMQLKMKRMDKLLSLDKELFKLIACSEVEKEIAQKKKEAWKWVEKSKKLDSLKNLRLTPEELVERLIELNVPEEIIESPTFKSAREQLKKWLNDPRLKKNFVKSIITPFLQRGVVIDELITLYYLIAFHKFTQWFDGARKGGKIIHPAFEVMRSDLSIGVGVLNNLAVEFRKDTVIEELVKIAPTQFQIGSYLIVNNSSFFALELLKRLKETKVQHRIIRNILERR